MKIFYQKNMLFFYFINGMFEMSEISVKEHLMKLGPDLPIGVYLLSDFYCFFPVERSFNCALWFIGLLVLNWLLWFD